MSDKVGATCIPEGHNTAKTDGHYWSEMESPAWQGFPITNEILAPAAFAVSPTNLSQQTVAVQPCTGMKQHSARCHEKSVILAVDSCMINDLTEVVSASEL